MIRRLACGEVIHHLHHAQRLFSRLADTGAHAEVRNLFECESGLGLLYKEKAEGFNLNGDFEQETVNYNEAAKYFSSAVKQLSSSPDGAVVYQLLGLIYEQQKKYKEAIVLYEEFLALFPDSAESTAVRSYIVQLKKQMNDPK